MTEGKYYFEIDRLQSAGIVRIFHESNVTWNFNCIIPIDTKEEDVSGLINGIINNIKDAVRKRKTWRFKETANRRKKMMKNHSGYRVKPFLDDAMHKRHDKK